MNNFNIKNTINVSIYVSFILLMAALVPVSAVETGSERSATGHGSEQLSIEQIIDRHQIGPAYIKSSFAEILQKKTKAKSEEERMSLQKDLEKLLRFSFILGDLNDKRPKEGTKEEQEARNQEYWELIFVNKKMAAVLGGRGKDEMDKIDREFAEEKEKYAEDKEKRKKSNEESEELFRRMEAMKATLRASNDEGEEAMGGFARFFRTIGWYAPAEDPRRRGMEIQDGSTAMVEEVPDDTPATRSSSGAASGARAAAPGRADSGRLPQQGR